MPSRTAPSLVIAACGGHCANRHGTRRGGCRRRSTSNIISLMRRLSRCRAATGDNRFRRSRPPCAPRRSRGARHARHSSPRSAFLANRRTCGSAFGDVGIETGIESVRAEVIGVDLPDLIVSAQAARRASRCFSANGSARQPTPAHRTAHSSFVRVILTDVLPATCGLRNNVSILRLRRSSHRREI